MKTQTIISTIAKLIVVAESRIGNKSVEDITAIDEARSVINELSDLHEHVMTINEEDRKHLTSIFKDSSAQIKRSLELDRAMAPVMEMIIGDKEMMEVMRKEEPEMVEKVEQLLKHKECREKEAGTIERMTKELFRIETAK